MGTVVNFSEYAAGHPRQPEPQPQSQQVVSETTAATVNRLSEEFLRQAVTMHSLGESGVDIYRAMIMAICKLICRSDDDPTIIDRRLAASHGHMLEARKILSAAGYDNPFPGPTKAS